jgi:hypothetical protein
LSAIPPAAAGLVSTPISTRAPIMISSSATPTPAAAACDSAGSSRKPPFLGATFVYAGIQKLSDPGFLNPDAPTYIGTQLWVFSSSRGWSYLDLPPGHK